MTSTISFRSFCKELSAVWKQSLRQIRGITLLYGILTLIFIPLALVFLLTASLQAADIFSSPSYAVSCLLYTSRCV